LRGFLESLDAAGWALRLMRFRIARFSYTLSCLVLSKCARWEEYDIAFATDQGEFCHGIVTMARQNSRICATVPRKNSIRERPWRLQTVKSAEISSDMHWKVFRAVAGFGRRRSKRLKTFSANTPLLLRFAVNDVCLSGALGCKVMTTMQACPSQKLHPRTKEAALHG